MLISFRSILREPSNLAELVRLRSRFATMLFMASKGFLWCFLTAPMFDVMRLLGFTAEPNFPEFTTRSILLMMSNKDESYLVVNGQHTVCMLIQFLHGQHTVIRRGDDIVFTGRINRCHKPVHFWEFIFKNL